MTPKPTSIMFSPVELCWVDNKTLQYTLKYTVGQNDVLLDQRCKLFKKNKKNLADLFLMLQSCLLDGGGVNSWWEG